MSQSSETLTKPDSVELVGITFENAEVEVRTMAALAEYAGNWGSREHPAFDAWAAEQPSSTTEDNLGHVFGLRQAQFQEFVGQRSSFDETRRNQEAAKLQFDISRFVNQLPLPEDPTVLENPQLTDSSSFSPIDVMRYAAHKMKETGIPFEGTPAEAAVDTAYANYQTALGYNPKEQFAVAARQEALAA